MTDMKHWFAIALWSSLLLGCSSDEGVIPRGERAALSIESAGISAQALTRADAGYTTLASLGDAVGLYRARRRGEVCGEEQCEIQLCGGGAAVADSHPHLAGRRNRQGMRLLPLP